MRRAQIAAALAALALPAGASASEIKIVDVKAYVFLERAGRLSDDLIPAGQAIVNAPRGGSFAGDTATALLVDVTFAGDRAAAAHETAARPAGAAAPKLSTATVDIVQTGHTGEPIVTHRSFDIAFGPEGAVHKAIFLEAATCMPLSIEVHAGRSAKSARLDFACEVARAPN